MGGWGISEVAFRWIPLDLTDDKSTLVQFGAVSQKAITWAKIDLFIVHSADHN